MFNTLSNAILRMHSAFRNLFSDSTIELPSGDCLTTEASESDLADDLAIGLREFELKHYSAAASAFARVSSQDLSKFAIALEWLGTTFLKIELPDLAIEPLQRALQLDTQLGRDPLTLAECHFSLGLAYARTGHDEAALDEFRDALRCAPDWGTVLFEIARVHARRNRIVQSVSTLSMAAGRDEAFLDRARRDFDFATVRQSVDFQQLLGKHGDVPCDQN
jgi:tetratricopeptide (TPR) repeat protein